MSTQPGNRLLTNARIQKILGCILPLLVLFASVSSAQSAGEFARIGFSARGIALGNAGVADGFGEGHPYYNPALAPYMSDARLEAAYSAMTFDRSLQFFQVAAPMKPNAGISGGIIRAAVNNIDGRDGSGYHTGDYSTNEYAFFVAFGTRIGKRTSFGIRLAYYRADLFDDVTPATNLGLSTGLLVRAGKNLRIGIAIDDLLARYSWNTTALYEQDGKETTDAFPARYRIGAAYHIRAANVTVQGEYESRVSERESRLVTSTFSQIPGISTSSEDLAIQSGLFRIGAEWDAADVMAVRLGIDRIGNGPVLPSAGFMLKQSVGELPFRFGYAFKLEPHGTGTMHVLSVQLGI